MTQKITCPNCQTVAWEQEPGYTRGETPYVVVDGTFCAVCGHDFGLGRSQEPHPSWRSSTGSGGITRMIRLKTCKETARDTFGYSPQDPILCGRPEGERVYLNSLQCPNGKAFQYRRIGPFEGKCPDLETHSDPQPGCIVDKYELQCQCGEHRYVLFFDMYHFEGVVQPAPKGLS
jgi:hypothetical protein